MGEETEPTTVAEGVTADEPSRDHHRKRKKHLHKSLLELMEFYLGDANLRHDKFLGDRIQGKPYVKDLAKAVKHSQFLQLSEDETQVCRITPVMMKENEDDCTIYVEQLGPDVNHEILTKVFSEFGPVDYISLPKYAHNGKFKGFGFIEFRDPECAKKALEALSAKGCCLSPYMAPEELVSIKTFDADNKHQHQPQPQHKKEQSNRKKNKRKQASDVSLKQTNDEDINPNSSEEEPQEKKLKLGLGGAESCDGLSGKAEQIHSENRKRKLSSGNDKLISSDSAELKENKEEEPVEKRIKSDNEESIQSADSKLKEDGEEEHRSFSATDGKLNSESIQLADSKSKEDGEEEHDKKRVTSETEGASATEETSHTEEEETAVNSSKQQKKRKRKKKLKKDKVTATSLGLRVLSKREWKTLRNKYLNMQREVMGLLKHQLNKQKPEIEERKLEEGLKLGTVIKVTLEEPVNNLTATKSEFRIHPEIRYVDAKEGSSSVYLRTSSPDFAASIVQTKHWPNMEIIQGDEETAYWDKIKKDRKDYFKQKPKRNVRGRTKLLKRAEKFQEKQI